MKNIFVLACSLVIFASCADKSKEVEVNETTTENPVNAESVAKDTMVSTEQDATEVTDIEVKKEAEEDKKVIEVAPSKDVKVEYASFGDKISADKALSKEQMLAKYKTMKKGDTIAVKFKSKINSVCKKKGCWMKMDLAGNESFVKFKDYAFFVPLNADNSEAIVSGKAFVNEISVAELKHYEKDAGKSQAEIDKITQPKITYAFQADGVLITK